MEIDQNLVELLHRAAGSGEVVTEEPMSRHTTFRIGGPADYFVTPHTKEEIRQVIQLCKAESLPLCRSWKREQPSRGRQRLPGRCDPAV